ncbi:TetR/AcrR family transcriptional regulator [Embleya sp. NPDC050493]|uniref:TetR/AcrR family transcriptional regulator n=1 Tax=Embleya sp. NPDC050493 TaxID=3363989 RepID=UPI00378F9460
MVQSSTDAPSRGRGRPARLSRGQIVDAAVGLVYQDPSEPLTVKRVAEAAGSAPMALYRYFPDRDDLLFAVADRVASDMEFDRPAGSTWQEELRNWMWMSLEYLRPYTQLLPYIASTRQPAWLPAFVLLTEILEPLELGDEDLALAVALVSTTIVGQATLAARRVPAPEMVSAMRDALEAADPADRARVGPVLEQLPGAFERLYDRVIDATLAALASMGEGTEPAAPATPPRKRAVPTAPLFSNPSPW